MNLIQIIKDITLYTFVLASLNIGSAAYTQFGNTGTKVIEGEKINQNTFGSARPRSTYTIGKRLEQTHSEAISEMREIINKWPGNWRQKQVESQILNYKTPLVRDWPRSDMGGRQWRAIMLNFNIPSILIDCLLASLPFNLILSQNIQIFRIKTCTVHRRANNMAQSKYPPGARPFHLTNHFHPMPLYLEPGKCVLASSPALFIS